MIWNIHRGGRTDRRTDRHEGIAKEMRREEYLVINVSDVHNVENFIAKVVRQNATENIESDVGPEETTPNVMLRLYSEGDGDSPSMPHV